MRPGILLLETHSQAPTLSSLPVIPPRSQTDFCPAHAVPWGRQRRPFFSALPLAVFLAPFARVFLIPNTLVVVSLGPPECGSPAAALLSWFPPGNPRAECMCTSCTSDPPFFPSIILICSTAWYLPCPDVLQVPSWHRFPRLIHHTLSSSLRLSSVLETPSPTPHHSITI